MNTSSSSSNNKRTAEADCHSDDDNTSSPPLPPSKKIKSTTAGNDPTTTKGTTTNTNTNTTSNSSTNVGTTTGSGSGSNTNAQDLSKIPREALERIVLAVHKNNVDKEAISILKEEQEKANKMTTIDDEQLLSKSEALERFAESVSILKKQQENAKMKKEQQISLIPKIPREEVDEILLAIHKNEMDKAMSLLETSYNNQEIRDGVLENEDFMMNIMSFVGPGHYIYVAGVSKKFKQYYLDYFNTLQQDDEIPIVDPPPTGYGNKRKAKVTDTFHSAAFTSVSRAKFWDQLSHGRDDRLQECLICMRVAREGNLDVLKWARQQKGFHLDEDTCTIAAENGHWHILKWARQIDRECNEFTCSCAAEFGNLAVLQWAREQDPPCPWDTGTCVYAAANGHLAVLQWALDNGCPWEEQTWEAAISDGPQEVVDWLRENGYLEAEED